MAKKVKYKDLKNIKINKKRKKQKRQQLFLLISCLMLVLTICWYVISLSSTINSKENSKGDSVADTVQLKRVGSVSRDNSRYATGNYANVYNYLNSIKQVANNG